MTAIVPSLHTSFTSCSAYSRLRNVGLSPPRFDFRMKALRSAARGDSTSSATRRF